MKKSNLAQKKSLITNFCMYCFLSSIIFFSTSSTFAQSKPNDIRGAYKFKDHTVFKAMFRVYTTSDGIYVDSLTADKNDIIDYSSTVASEWHRKLMGFYKWDPLEKKHKKGSYWVKYYNAWELGIYPGDNDHLYYFIKEQNSLSSLAGSKGKGVSHLIGTWKIKGSSRILKTFAGIDDELVIQDQRDMDIYELKRTESIVEKYEGLSRNGGEELLVTVISNKEIKLDLGGNILTAQLIGQPAQAITVASRGESGIAAINEKDISGNTKLHRAAYNRKYEDVEELLDVGADVNAKNNKGETALHKAVGKGDAELVSLLLKNKANVHIKDNSGQSAFVLAIGQWQPTETSVVDAILENNVTVTNECLDMAFAKNSNNEELIISLVKAGGSAQYSAEKAVKKNNLKLFNAILKSSSDEISITDRMFDNAVDSKSYMLADVLISKGANPHYALKKAIASDVPDLVYIALESGGDGTEALAYAVKKRDEELAKAAIKDHDANASKEFVNAVNSGYVPMVELLIEEGKVSATKGLSAAVSKKNDQMVIALLERDADPNAAISQVSGLGYDKMLRIMINNKYKGNPNLGVKAAALNNHNSTLNILLDAGADANLLMPIAIEKENVDWVALSLKKKAKGNNPAYIDQASKNGNTAIVSMLLNAGASPDDGIVSAANNNHTGVLKVLLDAGANPNPVMPIAIEKDKADWVKMCLSKGASVTEPRYIKKASLNGNATIVTMLLDDGADPNNGIMSAVKGNHLDVTEILTKAGADVSNPQIIAIAAPHNNAALIKVLLDAGADADAGVSPAVITNAHLSLQQLIDAGADAARPSLLMLSVKKGYNATAVVLLNVGLDANALDNTSGRHLIHFAAQSNNSGMVKILLGKGADVNATTKDGKSNTALHLVVPQGKTALTTAQTLIKGGADVNARNAESKLVFKVAKTRKMKKLLKDNGAKKK